MNNCKHLQGDEICTNAACPYCADYCPVTACQEVCKFAELDGQKVTNLDRFRTMTADELAEWLKKHAICFHDVYCCDCFPGKNCKYGWLRWLNKEYKPEPQK